MSTFIGVATSTLGYLEAYTSITNIRRAQGDHGPEWFHSARGDISRNSMAERIMDESCKHSHILMLDGDMTFPPDLLARMLAHDKPFVAGLYFRRDLNPMWPLAFEYHEPPVLPATPLFDYPDSGLVKVNASGSGCWLIRREVFFDVQELMEQKWAELLGYPVDVPVIMDGPMPEWRGDCKRIGADLRFCMYARMAGHDIWLDCDMEIGHVSHIPLTRDHYEKQGSLANVKAGCYKALVEKYKEQGQDEGLVVETRLKQRRAEFASLMEKGNRAQSGIDALKARGMAMQDEIAELEAQLEQES